MLNANFIVHDQIICCHQSLNVWLTCSPIRTNTNIYIYIHIYIIIWCCIVVCLQDLCEGAIYYADLIHAKLKASGYYDEVGQFDITEQVCV